MILFYFTLLISYVYLGARLAGPLWEWIYTGIPFLFILSFPFKKRFRWQLHLTYAAMGLLTYLFLFTVLRDLILLLTGKLYPANNVLILTLTCNVIGLLNALTGPRLKKILIPLSDDLKELDGIVIAQISDLHIGPTIRKRYVEKVVKKINQENVDLVVMTGDIGDGSVHTYRNDTLPLRFLKSRYGTFFTPGNHEYYWNVNEWLTLMNNIGVINLVNRGKIINHLNKKILVAGIPDPVSGVAPDLSGVQEAGPSEDADYKILLSHRPGIAHEATKVGFHLQLSGHTHGGQFFPWTIVVKFVHRLSKGLHELNGMYIYVSQGTGSWGPPLRLGTTSEITLLTLSYKRTSLKKFL